MVDTPGIPFIRWSADRKYVIVGPGVESDDFKLDNPVEDLGAATLLALQGGTNRVVTRPIPPGLGDVVGPPGATDNALARYDGPTGTLIQNSAVTLDDAGGLAGVATINGQPVAVLANEGGGAQVFHVGTPGTLRTFAAGPGLTLAQDAPVPGEIELSADEVTPAGAPAVPAALDLYVSQAGSDAGAGTAGSPYRTLPRAFRDIRVLGYDATATVTILASGGPYAIPPGVLPLGQGSRGRRAQPVEIRGSGRTAVDVGLAVLSAAQDPMTGLLDVTVAAPPAGPFALGQIVRFTSGPLAAFAPPGTPFPPTAIECFVAEVVSPTTVRLPFALGAPAPGNTFDVLTLDTLATVTGAVLLRGARLPLVFRDLRVDLLPAAGQGTLVLQGATFGLVGVWLRNAAPFGQLINVASQAGTGRAATVLSSITYTALGVYIDNTAPGGGFARNAIDPTATLGFANSVFRGNGLPGNLTLLGPIPTLAECYFAATGSVRVTASLTQANNVWFDACSPDSNAGVLEVQAGGTAAVDALRARASAQHGVRALTGALLALSNAAIGGCAGDAVRCEQGGTALTRGLALAGNAGRGIALTGRSALADGGLLDATGASAAAAGVLVEEGSVLYAGALTSSGNGGDGLQVLQGGAVWVGGALTCSANAGDGLRVDRSTLAAGSTAADGNGGAGVRASGAASLTCGAGLSASSNAQDGAALTGAARLEAEGMATLSANGGQGLSAAGVATVALSDLTAGANAQNGVLLRGASRLYLGGGAALSANLAGGLDADEASAVVCGGAFTAAGNAASGLAAAGSSLVRTGDASLDGNGANGLSCSSFAAVTCGALSASNNAQSGALLSDADLTAGPATFQGNLGGSGVAFTRSSGRFNGDVTATLNGGVGANQVALAGSSWVAVAGTLTDPGPSAAVSVALSSASTLGAGGLAVSGAGDLALSVRDGSHLVVDGALLLTGSLSGVAAAFVSEGSSVQAGVLTATGNAGAGFLLLGGAQFQSPNAITCTGNGSHGFAASEGAQVAVAGAACNGNAGAGIRVDGGGSLRALGLVDCGANAAEGLGASYASSLVTGALASGAGPNGATGVAVHTGSRLQTVAGNTMTGAGGDVVVGVNAAVPWATIDTKSPAVVTDYLAAQPATELCSVST